MASPLLNPCRLCAPPATGHGALDVDRATAIRIAAVAAPSPRAKPRQKPLQPRPTTTSQAVWATCAAGTYAAAVRAVASSAAAVVGAVALADPPEWLDLDMVVVNSRYQLLAR
jgi:hypothetical protein